MTLSNRSSEVPLTVRRDRQGAGVRLSIAGELDLMWVPVLTEELDRLELEDAPIVIDLVELTFMGCVGLAAFRTAARRAKTRGREFAIVNACRAVRRVFELTGNSALLASEQLVQSPPPGELSDA